ncbi:MAG: AAA family ATPase [Nitrospirota bacterium]
MDIQSKGRSPFYPGQPVPVELFTGRKEPIERIVRAASQVAKGKPQSIFLRGEYGIGKSSLAGYVRRLLEKEYGLFGIQVLLGGAKTIEDLSLRTVESILKPKEYEPTGIDNIREALSKYVEKVEFFGITVNLKSLKEDSPRIARGYLPFLHSLLKRIEGEKYKGIFLILDEINGIASNPDFAFFIKTLVDENALSEKPLPLLLMLCGVEERRIEMIKSHQPIDRIFDIAEIGRMSNDEMKEFFSKAFGSANMSVEDRAMWSMCHMSSGFPKLMHLIGDSIFWKDTDNHITEEDALLGIIAAAYEFGQRYVDQQVLKALQSEDYHSILNKISKVVIESHLDISFHKHRIEKDLTEPEKAKFNNFLQRMKKLKALSQGTRGTYIFSNRMIPFYIALKGVDLTSLDKKEE